MTLTCAGDHGSIGPVTVSFAYDPSVAASAQTRWAWIVLRPFWWAIWAIVAVVVLGSAIAGGQSPWVLAISLIFVGLVVAGATVLLRVVFGVMSRWRVRRPGKLEAGDEIRYMFDATSVTLDSSLVSHRLDWSLVRGFVLCDDAIFVQVGARTALALPTRVVDPDQFHTIVTIAPERLPIRRVRRFAPSEVVRSRRASTTG